MTSIRTLAAIAIAAGAALSGAQAQTMIGGGKVAPSFPITISQPGSYKLAGNLTVPAGSSGIVITASNVTLDLGGYAITGGNQCNGGWSAMTCTGSTNSTGIDAGKAIMASVSNGQVSGFGTGVSVAYGSTVSDMRISSISDYGILARMGSIVRNTSLFYVRTMGISAEDSLVEHVNISFTPTAISAYGGLVIGSVISNVGTGVLDGSYVYNVGPSLRETYIRSTTTPLSGNVRSLGSNNCNGSLC